MWPSSRSLSRFSSEELEQGERSSTLLRASSTPNSYLRNARPSSATSVLEIRSVRKRPASPEIGAEMLDGWKDVEAGHFGIKKTREVVARKYYHPRASHENIDPRSESKTTDKLADDMQKGLSAQIRPSLSAGPLGLRSWISLLINWMLQRKKKHG